MTVLLAQCLRLHMIVFLYHIASLYNRSTALLYNMVNFMNSLAHTQACNGCQTL